MEGGFYPFILLADFNDSPDTVGSSVWPEVLQASVVHTGCPTCILGSLESEIDFALISDRLVPYVRLLVLTIRFHGAPMVSSLWPSEQDCRPTKLESLRLLLFLRALRM